MSAAQYLKQKLELTYKKDMAEWRLENAMSFNDLDTYIEESRKYSKIIGELIYELNMLELKYMGY